MLDTTWKGTTGGDYLDSTQWDNLVPTSANNGIFGSTGVTRTITLAAGGVTAGGWIFNGGAYTIDISGSPVDLSGAGIQVSGTGSALIEVQSGGDLVFQNSSGAGRATIEAQSSGIVAFDGNNSAANARLIADSGGIVDFSAGAGPLGVGNVAGSIEGGGTFDLGGRSLTVGFNNRSTIVSGAITGTFGSSLTKVGAGTLTLSGSFGSTGAITIAGGTFDLDSSSLISEVAFAAGAQETLRIESIALPANDFAPLINTFGRGDTIDLPSLPFVPGATATYNTSLQTLSVTSGSTTINFESVAIAGTDQRFAVLGDDHGGSRVLLAIIESRPHKLVDATHRPPGQPSPNAGPDVVVALGANDTIKGLGGNDILVGGAPGDVLYGGTGADSFVFEKVKASPPAHPDTIWDFSHARHDKIDLYDLFHALHGHPLRFIGPQTFVSYHLHHPTVFGLVRYADGVVQVDVSGHAATQLAIVMHGAPALHAGDFIL